MVHICNDNRFELIKKYRNKLIEATNIEDSPEEMKVLNDILFRFWQMGWLDKLEIDRLPIVQPKSSWIPVSESLPEEYETVIASVNGQVYPESRYSKEDGWEWAAESCADYWGELEDVQAWMPLPKPYKEGE